MRKTMLFNLVRVALFRYFDSTVTKSNDEFEKYIYGSVGHGGIAITKREATNIIKYFRKQVFTLDRKTAKWLWKNMRSDEINFADRYKEIKKLKDLK
jgi:hypothetical protein